MKRFLCLMLTTCMMLSSVSVAYADDFVSDDIAEEVVIGDEAGDDVVVAEDAVIEEGTVDASETEQVIEEAEIVDSDEAIEEESEVVTEDESEAIEEETIEATEDDVADGATFSYKETVSGYGIALTADEGVFPEGTTVSVKKSSVSDENDIAKKAAMTLKDGESVAATAAFDFEFTDADGNVVEPEDGVVKVSVTPSEEFVDAISAAANANSVEDNRFVDRIGMNVYHVDGEAIELVNEVEALTEETYSDAISFDAAEFSSYALTVITHTTPDTKAPTLYSITIKNAKVVKNDRIIPEIIANVDDDLSGISTVEFRLSNSKSNTYIDVALKYNKNDGKYHAKVDDAVNPVTVAGNYTISKIVIGDKVGNYKNYSSIPSKFKKTIVVSNPKYVFAPVIKSVSASPNKVTIGASPIVITVKASVVNEYGAYDPVYIGAATFTFTPKTGGTPKEFTITMYPSGSPSSPTMAGNFLATYADMCAGTIALKSMTLMSQIGELADFSVKAGTLPKVNITVYGGDTTAPKVSKMTFNSSSINITKAKTVTLTANVSDDFAGVAKMNAVLSNGKQTIIVNNFKKSSNTKFTAKVKIYPTQAAGDYYLSRVYIEDAVGNSRTYTSKNISGTLAKTRITVVNDMSYNIKFNANGGAGTMSTMKNLMVGKAYTLKPNKFKRSGYVFAGWNTKANGTGKSYHDEETVKNLSTKSGATVTLYAQWRNSTTEVYNIAFNGNGATSGSTAKMSNLRFNTNYNLNPNGFKRTGYKFVCWNTKKDGTGADYLNQENIRNLTNTKGATVTLYAQWERN